MTYVAALSDNVVKPRGTATPIELVLKADFKRLLAGLSSSARAWVQSTGFDGSSGEVCLLPARDGQIAKVLAGISRHGDPWQLAKLQQKLPAGRYSIVSPLDSETANAVALGWMLGAYSFTRYKQKVSAKRALLVWPAAADAMLVTALAQAIALGRDLINTPAEDMGPAELSAVTAALAKQHGAKFSEHVGKELLRDNYPSIFAVGRASSREPRLLDLVWGNPEHPKVTLVGKGVCFDSGGLDLKPADNMKLMKKDMGGAATVLSVAAVVMATKLPVRLRVLIPAVENSIGGNAMRPLDVLSTRKGLSVEVGNTDAEGRLILSDALADADAEKPELLIDIATLTGAARVALGTTLPALFSNSDAAAEELLHAGLHVDDPLWRMPLHRPYRRLLDSKVADISNISDGAYGGAITAALFLQEFVSEKTPWLHIDTMAFNLETRPGRPYGGEVFAARALVEMLRRRYGKAAAR